MAIPVAWITWNHWQFWKLNGCMPDNMKYDQPRTYGMDSMDSMDGRKQFNPRQQQSV
jgi:hypothetical protein